MAHILETLASLNTIMLLGLVGCGLTACVSGALVYDVVRLLSAL
jgi:hypothetical protein